MFLLKFLRLNINGCKQDKNVKNLESKKILYYFVLNVYQVL